MALIDSTYPLFTSGDFNLYLQKKDYDFSKVLDDVCKNTEKDILIRLFGDVMYLDYENNPSNYSELINGYKVADKFASYEYLGKKRVYRGLKDMIAFFTYFFYAQNKFIFNPNIEASVSDTDRVNPAQNMLDAYMNGYKAYYDTYYFIKYKQSLGEFDDFDFTDIELINNFGI